MLRKLTWLLLPLWCLTLGCTPVNHEARLQEAMDLVQERLGVRPDWIADGDAATPDIQSGGELPLETALVTALRNNPELRADLAMIGIADADLLQAGLMSNPVINFMVMFPSGGGRSMLRGNALPMQPLQDLWLIPARKEVATAELQQAVVRSADRAVELAAKVKKAYVELQFAERSIELIRTNLGLVEQSISVIEIQQTAGTANQSEVNLARIRHERLRAELIGMEAASRASRYELLMLMGMALAAADWRAAPMDEMSQAVQAPPDETAVVLAAAERRLDLKAAEWGAEAAARRVTLRQREGWPDLALGFSFERSPDGRRRGATGKALAADAASRGFVRGFSGAQEMPEAPQIAPLPRPKNEVKYTLGPMFELELPIFDWNQGQTARARHEYEQRLAEYDALLQNIVRAIRSTIAEADSAQRQFVLFRDVILPDVVRNLELSQQDYTANQTDLTVFLQAQEDLISTRLKLLELLRDYRIREAELERLAGGERVLPGAATSQPTSATAESGIAAVGSTCAEGDAPIPAISASRAHKPDGQRAFRDKRPLLPRTSRRPLTTTPYRTARTSMQSEVTNHD